MRSIVITISLCFCIFLVFCSCDHEDWGDAPEGVGWTEDVGLECKMPCYEQWCENDDMIECRSGFCIGAPEQLYCTVPCDIDSECPEGYFCTEECTDDVTRVSVCVTQEDFALLQELEFCP